MRIHLTQGCLPRLEGAKEFRHFSIALDAALESDRANAVAAIGEISDPEHAWVRPDAVRVLSPYAGQSEWEEAFAKMVAFATQQGWTDEQGRIRAHIEPARTYPAIDQENFKAAMRRFASGVCIVAAGKDNERCGMTVSAFTSVSAEPPMVLVCLNRNSAPHGCVTSASAFSINILGAGQSEQAMIFAGQRGLYGAERFDSDWQDSPSGAPVLTTALHSLVCASTAQYEAGSHTVLIGRVIDTVSGIGHSALINFEGGLISAHRAA